MYKRQDCGRTLIRRVNTYKGNKKVYFICSSYNNGKECTRHSISEEVLKEIIFKALRNHIALSAYYWESVGELSETRFSKEDALELDNKIRALEKERKKYIALKSSLYDDMKDGLIDEKEFASFRSNYTIKIDEIGQAMAKHEELIGKVFKQGIDSEQKLKNISQYKNIDKLDRMSMVLFIDKIIIGENKEVEIKFCHEEDIHIIQNLLKQNNRLKSPVKREVV